MGRKAKNIAIDNLCREWGKIRRQVVGVDDPKVAKEYIGSLRSTLGERRDLHAGSRSNKVEQHWPEVYTGDSYAVNQAFHSLSPFLRVVMEIHYCANAPAKVKAEFLCVSLDKYWREVNIVRAFVDGFLARSDAA